VWPVVCGTATLPVEALGSFVTFGSATRPSNGAMLWMEA
jgi:hypothetical protein